MVFLKCLSNVVVKYYIYVYIYIFILPVLKSKACAFPIPCITSPLPCKCVHICTHLLFLSPSFNSFYMQNEFCVVNLFNLLRTRFISSYLSLGMKWLELNQSWKYCPQRGTPLVPAGNGFLYLLLCASSSSVTLSMHSSQRWWGKQNLISLFHEMTSITQIVLVAHVHIQSWRRRISYIWTWSWPRAKED